MSGAVADVDSFGNLLVLGAAFADCFGIKLLIWGFQICPLHPTHIPIKAQQNKQLRGLRIEFSLTLKTDSILEMPENFCQNKIIAQLTNLGSRIHHPFLSF